MNIKKMFKRTLIVLLLTVIIPTFIVSLMFSVVTAPIQYIIIGNPWLLGDKFCKLFEKLENIFEQC